MSLFGSSKQAKSFSSILAESSASLPSPGQAVLLQALWLCAREIKARAKRCNQQMLLMQNKTKSPFQAKKKSQFLFLQKKNKCTSQDLLPRREQNEPRPKVHYVNLQFQQVLRFRKVCALAVHSNPDFPHSSRQKWRAVHICRSWDQAKSSTGFFFCS